EGTARQLHRDGLGRLSPAGKTGTSNDGRDSWFAGYTGDHLAVVWVGNDQNEQTGLYGATGAMRVWSGLFSLLTIWPLRVDPKGVDLRIVQVYASSYSDAGYPGALPSTCAAGELPDYAACGPSYLPDPAHEEAGAAQDQPGFWRRLFGGGRQSAQPQQ